MMQLASFTFAHPEYFESLSRYQVLAEYREAIEPLLPDGWRLKRSDIWWMCHPEKADLPSQGFKIHVSATPMNADALIRRVVPVCVAAQTPFKVVADRNLLSVVQSKTYGRGSASKFFTIYPRDVGAFRELIASLHEATGDLESAYILSDRRYSDSRVLFYRYGGFQPRYRTLVTGNREPVIEGPSGELVPDRRQPFYEVPEWVQDPFGDPGEADSGDTVLAGRYEIREALAFSNSGGVYKALDRESGRSVVVKEARPRTASWVRDDRFLDAVKILHKEHRLLGRLQHLEFVPRTIDRFREWEHHFRVEEHIEGVPLTRYRARDDFALIPFTGERETTVRFCRKFRRIALQLVDAVAELHRHGVLVGDLSPNNVLLDEETLAVRLIDFESALDREDAESLESFSGVWSTPGYRAPGRLQRGTLEERDDHYALGMLLYSILIPVVAHFELAPGSKGTFIDKLEAEVGLPREVREVIFTLLDGELEAARRILQRWRVEDSVDEASAARRPTDLAAVAAELPGVVEGVADHLLATYDTSRDDRLWPTDYQVFLTNPLSIAYGACGTALFLHRVRGGVPEDVEAWLLDKAADPTVRAACPPGLYLGLAGTAWTLSELGHDEAAAELMDAAWQAPLSAGEPSLMFGAAGRGLASLWLHARTGDERHLERARRAGELLVGSAEARSDGLAWPGTVDDKVHYGMALGATGVGFFLLRLHGATGEERFLDAARRGLDFDLAAGRERKGEIKWTRWEGDELVEPYWLHGTSGVGTALVRFHAELGDERYLEMALAAGRSAFSKFTVLPGLFEGISSIGQLMVDLHRHTGDDVWRRRGLEIADTVLRYRIDRPDGVAFPGRFLLRISHGYAYGAAGIGLFVHRLATSAPRLLHDPVSPHAVAEAA
jgi:hypothetical protein